jgi:hypothetical protein
LSLQDGLRLLLHSVIKIHQPDPTLPGLLLPCP